MIASVLGMEPGVYIGVTLIIAGGAASLTGRALALAWRPVWMLIPAAAGLALADRFFVWALFDGAFYPLAGTLIEFVTLVGLAALAYRYTRVIRMVQQYPWLYERAGVLRWRPVAGGPPTDVRSEV